MIGLFLKFISNSVFKKSIKDYNHLKLSLLLKTNHASLKEKKYINRLSFSFLSQISHDFKAFCKIFKKSLVSLISSIYEIISSISTFTCKNDISSPNIPEFPRSRQYFLGASRNRSRPTIL